MNLKVENVLQDDQARPRGAGKQWGISPFSLKRRVSPHGQLTAVSMMKDEGPFVIEWVAQIIDKNEKIPGRRPYLDQISLPLAIQKAGLGWNILPEEQHFILGGSLRGEPLPEGREIFTVHYRKWEILKEVGLARQGKRMLEKQAGVRRIDQINRVSDGLAPDSD